MRDIPAYCIAGFATLVAIVALGLLLDQSRALHQLESRVQETQCVVVVSEDGYGYLADDEVSQECLREQLGWNLKP